MPVSNKSRENDVWPPHKERHPTSPSSHLLPPEEEPAAATTIPPPQEEPKSDAQRQSPSTPQSPWPSNLVDVIKTIVSKPSDRPTTPDFSFTFDMESAEKNYIILMKKYGGSLQRALEANSRSPLGIGSEFRASKIIEPLYRHHSIWPKIKHILTYGSHWPLEELPEEQRVANRRQGSHQFWKPQRRHQRPRPPSRTGRKKRQVRLLHPLTPSQSQTNPKTSLRPNEHPTPKYN